MIPKMNRKRTITIITLKIDDKATIRALIDSNRPSFLDIALRGLKIFISLMTLIRFKFVYGKASDTYDTNTISISNIFQKLLKYDVDPQFTNPNAIIFKIISKEKITVRTLSNTASEIKNGEFGSLKGLSAANCTVLKIMIKIIHNSKYLWDTILMIYCLNIPLYENTFNE